MKNSTLKLEWPLLKNKKILNLSSVNLFAQHPVAMLLFLLWLVSMIALPIVKFVWGPPGLPWAVSLAVVAQAGLVVTILQQAWGLSKTSITVTGIVLLTWLAEAIGTATGLPFGVYIYTDLLQPQVAHVPLLIPLAWLMMLPSAWTVAALISGKWSGPTFILLSALALTAWDLFLDPQMVAWGFWVWTEPGGYFGIPWLNFFGWVITAMIITRVVQPKPLPTGLLLLVYGFTWVLESLGLLLFWGLPGPAVVGFLAMGSLLWLALRNTAKDR